MDKTIPRHVAFIMDGNRRWAREHKLELLLGHHRGARQIEPLVDFAARKHIKFVTFWAFSTENWQRPSHEVQVLMEVFRQILQDPMMDRLKQNGVRLHTIGEIRKFPNDIYESLVKLIEETKENTAIDATIALNYGGRDEILRAVNMARKVKNGELGEQELSKYLYTSNIPDPDLLIRTGGDMRLSGFMPWQTVYTELYFTKTLWPDFDEKAFQEALNDYAERERRFGR